MLQTDARIAISRLSMSGTLVGSETTAEFAECLNTYVAFDLAKVNEACAAVTMKARERIFSGAAPVSSATEKSFIYNDGIAVVPVYGVLLNKFNSCWGFVTGYNFIRAQMNAADMDPDVTLIAFDVDSVGGDSSGCFELTEEIRALETPTVSVVDGAAASGGYAVAAAADKMYASKSSMVGSIGAYRMLIDLRENDAQNGVKIDYVVSTGSDFKLLGSPHIEMTDEMREWFQESIDFTMQEFVDDVIASRGLSEDDIRETKARIYRAKDALALGLIDDVSTPAEAVSAFVAELAADVPEDENEEDSMALPKTEAEMTAALDAARNEGVTSVKVPDAAQIAADAVKADRERSAAILALDEAKEKQGLAATVAGQGLTVDQAKVILAAAPVEKAVAVVETPKTPGAFVNSMDKAGGAGVAADDTPGGEQDDKPKVANFAAYLPANRRIKS